MDGDPCYVFTNGKTVLTANYSGGSMSVFTLNQKEQSLNSPPGISVLLVVQT